MWLKVHTADIYSNFDIPEWKAGEFVSLSSYRKCCDFMFFKAVHLFYGLANLWMYPQHAVFVSSKPTRDWA